MLGHAKNKSSRLPCRPSSAHLPLPVDIHIYVWGRAVLLSTIDSLVGAGSPDKKKRNRKAHKDWRHKPKMYQPTNQRNKQCKLSKRAREQTSKRASWQESKHGLASKRSKQASEQASKQASGASQQANEQASQQASKQTNQQSKPALARTRAKQAQQSSPKYAVAPAITAIEEQPFRAAE